jgi:hypothetical protein
MLLSQRGQQAIEGQFLHQFGFVHDAWCPQAHGSAFAFPCTILLLIYTWLWHSLSSHPLEVATLPGLVQQACLCTCLQACQACQEQLLRLHNLCNHPTLAPCLTEDLQAAAAAAIKPYASALLKLRCSSLGISAGRRSGSGSGASCASSCSGAAQGNAGLTGGNGCGVGPGGAVVQHHVWVNCMTELQVAAEGSLERMREVSQSVMNILLIRVSN